MSAEALTVEEDRRRRMVALSPRLRGPAPDCYRASAEWWRIHAEETAVPERCHEYANNQDAIADDMERRPNHYLLKPSGKTDFQWSQTV
jgi:hypothetical protein